MFSMKKLLVLFSIFIFSACSSLALTPEECDTLYENAQPFQSKLFNDIDPFQDEDNIKYAWSPYPLFRTSANLYFKDYKIEPGYYLLTPRTMGGKDYVLFKQNGKVSFVIPVAKKEKTPINFYQANTPKVKLTKMQKIGEKVKKKFYDWAQDSGRSTPPNSLVNIDVEIKYIIMSLYYGDDKYIVLFKRSPY